MPDKDKIVVAWSLREDDSMPTWSETAQQYRERVRRERVERGLPDPEAQDDT